MNPKLESDIKALETAIADLRRQQREEQETLKAETPIIWRYRIRPDARVPFGDELWDDSLRFYRLEGWVQNRKEAEAAGHDISEGGMSYLYNTYTEKLVMAYGGGRVFIGARWGTPDNGSTERVVKELSAFLSEYPEGGDITGIIARHHEER